MRSCCLLLFTILFATVLTPGSTSTACREIKPFGGMSLADENTNFIRKRSLRERTSASERLGVVSVDTEERMGVTRVKDAIRWLWNAIKVRVKMKYWLYRGIAPKDVLEKLKITKTTDTNYKYYSRYYYRYYVKYPSRQPPNLPKKTAEHIMMARLRDYLRDNRTPPQVFKDLGLKGTFESARGQQDYEYFELYFKMWSALQAKLAQLNANL